VGPGRKRIAFSRFFGCQVCGIGIDSNDRPGVVQAVTTDASDFLPDWRPFADTDGDALRDEWERNGIDANGDGTIDVDLPAMGAKPDRRDVFVELDHMTGFRSPRTRSTSSSGRSPMRPSATPTARRGSRCTSTMARRPRWTR
jgi:hypothetical protein